MKKTLKSLIIAALIGGSTQFAFAQERGEVLERLFSRMDQNNDGVIEESEAPAEFWSRISAADANKDGKIDKTEAAQGMKAMGGRRGQSARGPGAGGPGAGGPGAGEGNRPSDSQGSANNKDEMKGKANDKNSAAPGQAGNGDRARQLMERFGKDGKIALADLPAQLRDRLAKLDTNNDQIIDKSELKGAAPADMPREGDNRAMMERIQKMMQALDKDGDGKVAIEDIPGDFKERLAKLDKNNDGMLEKSEMAELRNMLGGGKGAPAGAMVERMQKLFSQYDKDGDGKVVLDELPEMARERLAKLDANNDGMIEKSELKGLLNGDKRPDGKGEGKPGEGRYGSGNEGTAPQAPKRPDSDGL